MATIEPIEHYLPQFFLRGFTIAGTGQVHYFQAGFKPRLWTVRKVGGEKKFYRSGVEQALQKPERQYAPLVTRLRDSEPTPSDKPLIEAFITHLVGRGRHTRESVVDIAVSAMDASRRALTAPEHQGQLVEVLVENALANPTVRALFSKLPMPQRQELQQQFLAIARAQVKAAADSGALAEMGQRLFTEVAGELNLPEMAKAGQSDAILREPPATIARNAFASLVWSVKRNPGFNYILGDVSILSQWSDGADLVHVWRGVGSLTAILLPISSTALLVGSTQEARPVDDETVNVASAELSRTFFVSAKKGPLEETYFSRLGKRAGAVDESVTGDLIRRALDDQRPKPTDG